MSGQLDGLAASFVLPAPRRTPWICVGGAKGGVGKTTIAVNLAILVARQGYRVLLADLDPGCGDVGVQLRLAAAASLDDAVAGNCAIADALVTGPAGIAVLLGQSGSTRLLGENAMAVALDMIGLVARDHDIVIADTGAGIGAATMAVAERSDLTLAITTPDAAAVTDTYAYAKVLQRDTGRLPQLVVNRSRSIDEAARTAAKLGRVALKFLGTSLELCAKVALDPAVDRGAAEQCPVSLRGDGPALADLRALCANALAAIPDTRRRALRPDPVRRLRPAAAR